MRPDCLIQVIFKKISINTNLLDKITFPSGNLSFIKGNKEYTEDITNGFVYTFVKRLKRREIEGRPQRYETVVVVDCEKHKIFGAGQSVCIPSGIDCDIYYAYSKIKLSEERLAVIKEDIRKSNALYPVRRVVKINSAQLFRAKDPSLLTAPETQEYFDAGKIYLYDWYGYLEQCADFYHGAVTSNYEEYKKQIEVNVALDGNFAESGLTL